MIDKKILDKVVIHKDQGYAFYFQHNDYIMKKVNGFEKDENSPHITFDTCFRLASVTKQFIALAIIQLVNNDKLAFSTKITDIFLDFPCYFDKITVQNLLNHTSGIYDYEDLPHKDDDKQIKDEDILSFLKTTTTTYFKPGTKYRYSNTAYILLGQIIERVTNKKLDTYLKENIFEKIGLIHTYVNNEGTTQIPSRAYGHLLQDEKIIVKDQYWCSATVSDGGIYSTINDLNKWIDYLLNDDFAKLKKTMFYPSVFDEKTTCYYGAGMRIYHFNNKDIYYHCGDTIGTNTFILFSPDVNLRCLFLTNMGNIDTENLKENIIKYLKEKD